MLNGSCVRQERGVRVGGFHQALCAFVGCGASEIHYPYCAYKLAGINGKLSEVS